MLNMIALSGIFLFIFVLMLLCFCISWKSFKSGNTVSTEYLNQIPNPEYPTGANVPNNTEINFYFLLYKKSFNLYFQICFLISEEKQQL